MSLEATILCSKSEARSVRHHMYKGKMTQNIFYSSVGFSSSLSLPELSLSSCSLSCSSSTKSIFLFILMSTGGGRSFEWSTLRCFTSFMALEILSLKQQGLISLQWNHQPLVQGLASFKSLFIGLYFLIKFFKTVSRVCFIFGGGGGRGGRLLAACFNWSLLSYLVKFLVLCSVYNNESRL